MTFDSIQAEYANNGARLLDGPMPDWFMKINTETLDMSSIDLCILGQLFGNYVAGIQWIRENVAGHADVFTDWACMGFTEYVVSGHDDPSMAFALLDIAWLDEINKRVAATL